MPGQGIKNETQGKWGADDYYNDEGSYSGNQKDAIRTRDIAVNWGDEVLPAGGPTATGTEGDGNGEPEPVPSILAVADSIF